MVNQTGDPHKDLASTVKHELLHVKHPNMKEMNIRKLEKTFASKMTNDQKKKLLSKLR